MKKQFIKVVAFGLFAGFASGYAQTSEADTVQLSELEIISSRYDKKTPFTATNYSGKQIQDRLASRDLPNVLNTSPSIYSTNQGGGAGDSRINVRGFTQRNTAIMINGVPVNDMENGWVYWSNWDGVGDATSSIQVQRGLSAVNLAVPSIGGTINVVTDPAARKAGSYVKQEMGSWNFRKTTVGFNTGLINDKFAMNGTIVKKTGDGFYDGTWTDAWAYYFGASYKITNNDKLEMYAIGAPQRHGQNLYRQNAARYDREYALGLEGYEAAAADRYKTLGRAYNQNVNNLDPSYQGQQYFTMYNKYNQSRFSPNFMNERENYFHKPQVNLNWYHNFNSRMKLSTIAYWSGGQGGGTGTYGSVKTNSALGYKQDWNYEVAENMANVDSNYSTSLKRSTGILRNSINQQYTWGAISKLSYDINENLNVLVGIDWRTAQIKHFREVRDLLGGDYFVYSGDDFATSDMKTLGDKVAYNNTNTVDWLGGYLQAKYTKNQLRAEVMAAYTNVSYSYTNEFKDDGTGNPVKTENKGLGGYQIKGGASYDWTSTIQSFANFGLVSRTPTFDGAIRDSDGFIYADPQNETFNSIDAGAKWASRNGKLAVSASAYYTQWLNRTQTFSYTDQSTLEEGVIYLKGMNAVHSGLELEVAYKPTDRLRIDLGASAGNWYLTDNISGSYSTFNADSGRTETNSYNFYVGGLKVGDAPQQQISAVISYQFTDNFNAQLVIRHYDNFYSDYDVFSRTKEELDADGNNIQSWKVPAYTVMDLHANYNVPVNMGNAQLSVFAHVFNLADAVYIQDATDNSRYNGFDKDHDADDAEIFLGLPRNFNAGFRVSF